MVRREMDGGWLLITQHDHAVLGYEIMKSWGNSEFCEIIPEDQVLFAIREHDSGWKQWDQRAWFNIHSGYPINFMEMFVNDQFKIWSESFEKHGEENKYAAALIAMHFAKFNNNTLLKNPDSGASKVLKHKINCFVTEMLDLEAEDNGDISFPKGFGVNLKLLQFADILSLALCHGWRSTVIDEVPLNYDDEEVSVKVTTEDGLNFEIDPNPFNKETINSSIKGKRLNSKKFKSQEELDEKFANSKVETLEFSINSKKKEVLQ